MLVRLAARSGHHATIRRAARSGTQLRACYSDVRALHSCDARAYAVVRLAHRQGRIDFKEFAVGMSTIRKESIDHKLEMICARSRNRTA